MAARSRKVLTIQKKADLVVTMNDKVKKDEHESISLDISKMQKLQAENDELRHKLESSNLMISVVRTVVEHER
eukprot:751533-Hanusia_phi.AAC.2